MDSAAAKSDADQTTKARPPQRRRYPALSLPNATYDMSASPGDEGANSGDHRHDLVAITEDLYQDEDLEPLIAPPNEQEQAAAAEAALEDGELFTVPTIMPAHSTRSATDLHSRVPSYRQAMAYNSLSYDHFEHVCNDDMSWRGEPVENENGGYVTSEGIISFDLNYNMCVDLTANKAIRLIDYNSGVAMSLSACGLKAAFIHSRGNVYQYPKTTERGEELRFEMRTNDVIGKMKYAKIWSKGISFTGDGCSLVYVVDKGGPRSSFDVFSDLSYDFTLPTFLNGSTHDGSVVSECTDLLKAARHWEAHGTRFWFLNGITVSQEPDGHVRVSRDVCHFQMRSNPADGKSAITTPRMICSADIGGDLSIKRGRKQLYYDGRIFIARNGEDCRPGQISCLKNESGTPMYLLAQVKVR